MNITSRETADLLCTALHEVSILKPKTQARDVDFGLRRKQELERTGHLMDSNFKKQMVQACYDFIATLVRNNFLNKRLV